jgi:hypothetical protein
VLDEERNDVNDVSDGVEDGALECWAFVGATGKEGTVVERTTYGQYGRCSLSKSISRAFGGKVDPVLLSVVGVAGGAKPMAQRPIRL